ncbi:MAG TPA: hypothetical protein VFE93_07725 [Myxococcaceae bacterium]|nr:hypothetical protein [Myxococcaceae bacterium]
MRRSLPGPAVLAPLVVAAALGCAFQGPTTTTKEPPPSNANTTRRESQDVELTASVRPTQKTGPVRLPVSFHAQNRSERPILLREENFRLVSADGSTHEVVRTRTSDGGQPGWVEHVLRPGERFDAVVVFDEVDPLAEQLTLDAFYTDVESGERGPEIAVPVKTRPDAVPADRTDAGGAAQ